MTKTLKTTLFALLVLSIAIPATSMAFATGPNHDTTAPLKVQLEETTNVEELSCPQSSHVLILKQSDNSPACVTSSTADKLVERGWGTLISA